MKTKIRFWIIPIFFGIVLLLFVNSCSEKEDVIIDTTIPIITTNEVSEITESTIICGGVITSDGGESIIERGRRKRDSNPCSIPISVFIV